MKTLFETMTIIALVLLTALCAMWLLQQSTVAIDGVPVGLWVPALGLFASMFLALGLVIGWNFEPRGREEVADTRSPARDIQRKRPLSFTVKKGKRYQANITLSFFEQVASNDMIKGMLEKAGFAEVKVSGSGGQRKAEATWPGDDATAEMPAQIVSAAELPASTSQTASAG